MKVGSLFAGIGGFGLGFRRAGFEVAWQVEIDDWCQKVLSKNFPESQKFRDVREVGKHNLSPVDVICGGFPCQPFSHAGKRGGATDDRYLWPEMLRVINEVRPTWVVGENVLGITSMEFEPSISEMEVETLEGIPNDVLFKSESRSILHEIIEDLERVGYDVQTFIIPACGVNAHHRRDRVWVVGHTDKNSKSVGAVNAEASKLQVMADTSIRRCSEPKERKNEQPRRAKAICSGEAVADRYIQGLETRKFQPGERTKNGIITGSGLLRGKPIKWATEPSVGRVANGISRRVDRLKGLGNAVVPQIPQIFAEFILEIETQRSRKAA